jgi:signal transduction histidine kinase
MPLLCHLDPVRIRQALDNVLQNAIEAMPNGGTLEVSVSIEGHTACVAVHDSGPGISVKDMDRIFDPYFSTKQEGLGLGLPISKKIIEAHGGMLRAASEQGRGSTFVIRLPVA